MGFEQLNPDWMWSKSRVQSVQLRERREREVNRPQSEVFAELRLMSGDNRQLGNDRRIYEGKGPLNTLTYYSTVCLLDVASVPVVHSPQIHAINMERNVHVVTVQI